METSTMNKNIKSDHGADWYKTLGMLLQSATNSLDACENDEKIEIDFRFLVAPYDKLTVGFAGALMIKRLGITHQSFLGDRLNELVLACDYAAESKLVEAFRFFYGGYPTQDIYNILMAYPDIPKYETDRSQFKLVMHRIAADMHEKRI